MPHTLPPDAIARRLADLDRDAEQHSTKPPSGSALLRAFNDGERAYVDRPLAFGRIRAALSSHSGPAGGYAAGPETVEAGVEHALTSTSIMRQVVSVVRRETANPSTKVLMDDVSNEGRIVAQSAAMTAVDVSFSARRFLPTKFSSDIVSVPFALLRDNATGDAELGRILGARIARGQNRKFTTGSGASEPYGIATAAHLGLTSSVVGGFAVDDLLQLAAAVPDEYASAPGAGWMMAKSTWLAARRLKDGQGHYLWDASGCGAWPVYFNGHMPALATGNRAVLFGDFSKYVISDVQSVRIYRVSEAPNRIENDLIAFEAFLESDGQLLDA